MKLSIKPEHLKYGVLGAGLLGALLRMLLYTTGTDEKGLLVTGHWAHITIWVLTFAVTGVLILCCRKIEGPEKYEDCFPTSAGGAAGAFLCAIGFLLTALSGIRQISSTLDIAAAVMGFISAAALACIGICRLFRIKPLFLCHAIVCVCFALRMVCQYRVWSSDPQLQDYCFYMAGHVGLMLTSYHLAAFDAGLGRHRILWFLGLASAYLSLLCLYGSQNSLFMLVCAIWVLSNLTNLTVRPRRVRPKLNLEDEPPQEGA